MDKKRQQPAFTNASCLLQPHTPASTHLYTYPFSRASTPQSSIPACPICSVPGRKFLRHNHRIPIDLQAKALEPLAFLLKTTLQRFSFCIGKRPFQSVGLRHYRRMTAQACERIQDRPWRKRDNLITLNVNPLP